MRATSWIPAGTGGLFIPLVVAGALTGSIIGGAIDHRDLSLFIVPGLLAAVAAELIMGGSSITTYQRAEAQREGGPRVGERGVLRLATGQGA